MGSVISYWSCFFVPLFQSSLYCLHSISLMLNVIPPFFRLWFRWHLPRVAVIAKCRLGRWDIGQPPPPLFFVFTLLSHLSPLSLHFLYSPGHDQSTVCMQSALVSTETHWYVKLLWLLEWMVSLGTVVIIQITQYAGIIGKCNVSFTVNQDNWIVTSAKHFATLSCNVRSQVFLINTFGWD